MMKFIYATVVMLLFASVSNAQLKFGVKAGANISNLNSVSSVIDQVKGTSNYQIGVLIQAKAFGFAIQPEVLYSVKGGQFDNLTPSSIINGTAIDYQSQNIEIPVNLQYGIGFGPARVYLQGGPYVSFLTGARVNGSIDDYESLKDNISTFDYGVGVGAGAQLFGLQVSVKYDWGLSKLGVEALSAGNEFNPFYELKNRNLSISAAYLF